MTFLDFFSGIGGFRLGLEQAGHKCLGHCEWDKYANYSYKAMHQLTHAELEKLKAIPAPLKKSGEPNLNKRQKYIKNLIDFKKGDEWFANDIRTVRADDIPHANCWCFGFPCQDISVAGKQNGFSGERSSLFFAVTSLIKQLQEKDKPSYLFIENVKNLLSVNKGWDFTAMLVELDEIGYDAEWAVVNSADVVAQNRERIFIIGHLRGRCTAKVFPIEGASAEVNQADAYAD